MMLPFTVPKRSARDLRQQRQTPDSFLAAGLWTDSRTLPITGLPSPDVHPLT